MESLLLVSFRVKAYRGANHAVAFLETCYLMPDCYDFTGDVLSQNCRVVEREKGRILNFAIDWVDGNSVVLYEDLVLSWSPKGSGLDLERTSLGCRNPGGSVDCHGVLAFAGIWKCDCAVSRYACC